MKKHLLIFTSTLLLGAVAAQGTIFLGVPNANITNAASWDDGLPVIGSPAGVGTINIDGNFSGPIASWEVNHTGGTLTTSFNRSLGAIDGDNSGTIWNLSGGNLVFTGANLLNGTTGNNFSYQLNISGGSLTAANIQNTANSTVNLSGGSINISSGYSLQNGTLNITGGSLTAGSLSTNGSSRINFFTGSTGTITITGFGLSDYETLWTQTRLRFDGGNVGSFADHFVVTGSTLAVIPEPSTYAALFGLAALALVVYRRRRTA